MALPWHVTGQYIEQRRLQLVCLNIEFSRCNSLAAATPASASTVQVVSGVIDDLFARWFVVFGTYLHNSQKVGLSTILCASGSALDDQVLAESSITNNDAEPLSFPLSQMVW